MTTEKEQRDSLQWLSISEETLFLHDGLMRVTELVELPHDISNADQQLNQEVVSFDSKSPTELCEMLRNVCGTHNNANARLLEYRLNALRGLWTAMRHLAIEVQKEKTAAHEALLKKPNQWKEQETGSFSTQVSLLLVLPLLQSQSRIDSSLCGVTANLLLKCLRNCSPLSLTREPSDCLDGLESLLSAWLGEPSLTSQPVPLSCLEPIQRQNAASALVALACARGSLATFIHIVHLLQDFPDIGLLPVGDILEKLLSTEGGQSQLIALSSNHHVISWGFDDILYVSASKSNTSIKNAPPTATDKGQLLEIGRSLTCDGRFFYISNSSGKGIIKVGTGLHGTIRGYTYARNPDLTIGWLAYGDGVLLHRPQMEFDSEDGQTKFVNVIDICTLEPLLTVVRPVEYMNSVASISINLFSDGSRFYWIWTNSEKNSKVFLDVFSFDESQKVIVPLKSHLLLQKKDEIGSKCAATASDPSIIRLKTCQPSNGAGATTLIALTPSTETQTTKKDETSGSSVGISLKMLLKTSMFCDGKTLVMLTNPPGSGLANTARSLFGSGSNMSGVRSLASNNWFNLEDGHFVSRTDLLDVPSSALSKSSSISGVGVCYDVFNNLIWCCTNDYIDQFLNPGHMAKHHILSHLGLTEQQQQQQQSCSLLQDKNLLSPLQVVGHLLQHIGTMCLHEINSHTNNDLSVLSFLLIPSDSDGFKDMCQSCNMSFVCHIIEKSMSMKNEFMLMNCLVLLQYLFQTNSRSKFKLFDDDFVSRLRKLLWQIFDSYQNADFNAASAILRQVSKTMTCGLWCLYPDPLDRINLLQRLISEGNESRDLTHFRDLLLIDFANQLQNPLLTHETIQFLWLNHDMVHHILKIAVNESSDLVRKAKTNDRNELNRLLASTPIASPCVNYLMALQSSIIKHLVLKETLVDSNGNSPPSPLTSNERLHSMVLALSSNIFAAAAEVFEVLLDTCNYVINRKVSHLEFWLQGLEHIAKATILGHLLPLLITGLTDKNVQCLMFADRLMSPLVQLVILSSRSATLLKSCDTDDGDSDDMINADEDNDVVVEHLVDDRSQNINSLGVSEEEEGFLTGLRTPAPWNSGKTIESVHPVRDNYKFKETVHILGAKCLFLRFDPRCATQYDYDKLVLYAGSNTGCRKVGEYGGNTFGFGSRSVLGSGWPKDLIKVEGDTVTFSFEMRSGREHNSPDKALWGFLVTVKAQESNDDVSGGIPFVADLSLGLSVLSCMMLHLLFQGPCSIPEEETCQPLLNSKLLQKCIWHGNELEHLLISFGSSDGSQSTGVDQMEEGHYKKALPRIKLPSEIIHRLRVLSEKHEPQMRPSMREVIKTDALEEIVLSATIRHLTLTNIVQNMTFHEQKNTTEYRLLKEIMSELYKRLYALLRQLQTIAEMEQKWNSELDDLKQRNVHINQVFFIDYHLAENKVKELVILCFLKDVLFDPLNLEDSVSDLCDKMSCELNENNGENIDVKNLSKTKSIYNGLMERLNLLLQVTIVPEINTSITRSTSCISDDLPRMMPNIMVRSDTDVLKSGVQHSSIGSTDVWIDDSIIDIFNPKKNRYSLKKGNLSIHHRSVSEDEPTTHIAIIDQIFSFIGSSPEKTVLCKSFLSVAHLRWRRGKSRTQALVYIKELLKAATQVGSAIHLVAAVTAVLQDGPRVEELQCGGMVTHVREAFADTMLSVVQLAAKYPIACCNSIGLLCIIPYTRAEEKCLVRSGLVHLLDKLCSLTNCREDMTGSDIQSVHQRVSMMAWAGFQVLSNRCIMWENDKRSSLGEFEHSGLARQVSVLLTNHLSHATEGKGNEAASNEAMQEVLNLLNNLSRSKMGETILSQPACVSKLLSLLLDQRPSPKLVLIILQLCRVSLPLMSIDECEKVELPAWGQDIVHADHGMDKSVRIVSLLLAKLGDFLVPGSQTTISSQRESVDRNIGGGGVNNAMNGRDQRDDPDIRDGHLSVFIHKRDDQNSHEVVQPLLSTDSHFLRLSGGANMEKVVRMDREMTKSGKAEATTEEAASSLRKAARWAQMGLVVSTCPPVDSVCLADNGTSTDKKKIAAEVICKEKNVDLAKTDAVRPFISSHVANSMASEVIALLHSLIEAVESRAADTWTVAIDKVISKTLLSLPELLSTLDEMMSVQCNKEQLMCLAKQINATLAAVGAFKEMIKPGCNVKIVVDGCPSSSSGSATVVSVSEQTGLATIQLQPSTSDEQLTLESIYSETVQIPISRLKPLQNQLLPLHKMTITESLVTAIKTLLLPQRGPTSSSSSSPLFQQLPVYGSDASTMANQICRVVAEIKTRACQVLSCYLKETAFVSQFIQDSSFCIEYLKVLANECSTGERLSVTDVKCERLRMLYIDCAKPPPLQNKTTFKPIKDFAWKPSMTYPPVRSCLFSSAFTDVTFFGDPSSLNNLPRGVLIYSTQPIPQATSFYWEINICSYGDTQDDGGPILSFGFMPVAEKKDGSWTNPIGSCLFHNNGRVVHYNGSGLLQWRSVRLDVSLGVGDVAGIGWNCHGNTPPPPPLAPLAPNPISKGLVYFTYNGQRLSPTIDEVSGCMWPVVHIQKKNIRIRANFGGYPFVYADGSIGQSTAFSTHDLVKEIRDTFTVLPFHISSDSDSEGPTSLSTPTSDAATTPRTPPGPPCRTAAAPKALREYNPHVSSLYNLALSYSNMTQTGPDLKTQLANVDDESDLDEKEENEPTEDNYTLLVKAWEQKVFPIIRRRFRNEAERKDGLEQIKGALQLGMTDIARQTVEFLYEENGGMPRDLHLPSIDDIKDELAKFSIERLHKGSVVVIKNISQATTVGRIHLPKFAVRTMLKTFGVSMSVVLDVDQLNELVEVETYLKSEGILVRYWYPLEMLERPAAGFRKSSFIVGHNKLLDTSNINIHRELLKAEYLLLRMFCRSALLELINQCNSPAMATICYSSQVSPNSAAAAACAALLQELDVENLQLLSNDLLVSPEPHGTCLATSLLTSRSIKRCYSLCSSSLPGIFYDDESSRLKEELRVAINRAANQGEDYILELSNQICLCLQTAPEMFPCEEFNVSETKICTDVHFPGMAFLVVSCRTDPKAIKKDTSIYKSPWARVFVYRGQRIKRSGASSKQEVISYPREISLSGDLLSDRYAPVIIPADLVHVRVGVSPPPGMIIAIHGIPPQLPLAIAYIETLILCQVEMIQKKKEEDKNGSNAMFVYETSSVCNVTDNGVAWSSFRSKGIVFIPSSILLRMIELMNGYLSRTDVVSLVKEMFFRLLSQTLRVLYLSRNTYTVSDVIPSLSSALIGSKPLFTQLQSELYRLYEEETKSNQGEKHTWTRYSFYLQSLVELCLTIAEVTRSDNISSPSPSVDSLSPDGSRMSSTLLLVSTPSKHKKIGTKRERGSSTPKRGSSPRGTSENDSPMSTSPHASASTGALVPSPPLSCVTSASSLSPSCSKPEDHLWFHSALTVSQILCYLVDSDVVGQFETLTTVSDASLLLTQSTVHSRLLVISNIPKSMDVNVCRNAIYKAVSSNGGLFMEDLYLPLEEINSSSTSLHLTPIKRSDQKTKASQKQKTTDATHSKISATKQQQQLKGFAVLQIRCKSKMEMVQKSLSKCKLQLIGTLFEEMSDLAEDVFTVSTVNQMLLTTEELSNTALNCYLLDKLVINRITYDMSERSIVAFTDIFHSCFFVVEEKLLLSGGSEERHSEDCGYIYLTGEQIVMRSSENLLCIFLQALTHTKKSLNEHVLFILRRYGVSKNTNKEETDKKSKKPLKTMKEKLMVGIITTKSCIVEKRSKSKEETLEKKTKMSTPPKNLQKPNKEYFKDEKNNLTLDGFLSFIKDKVKEDPRVVFRALLSCGFDLQFDRFTFYDTRQARFMSSQWMLNMDYCLVNYVNHLCHRLAISPFFIHPHEIYLEEAELNSSAYSLLRDIPLDSIRLRFAFLQSLNETLSNVFLPLIDMRPSIANVFPYSIAFLVSRTRGLIFYDTKMDFVNRVLNSTTFRKADQPAPEVTLNPLDNIQLQSERRSSVNTYLCQALKQLTGVSSTQLCVALARGGDPTYSFNIRFSGEEVHGTSGSFRHFLWHVAKELEHRSLDVLIASPSSLGYKSCGKFLLSSGAMTFSMEKILQFFGQLLGVAVRACIPFGLDLSSVFWKNLVNIDLDLITDIQESDLVTYSYIKKLEMSEDETELMAVCNDQMPFFVYPTLNGDEIELIDGGRKLQVNWENRLQYIDLIRSFRMKELRNEERMLAIKSGLSSVIPLQLLMLMTPYDAEFKTCGLPEVNLQFLKIHTIYQVGLSETDTHIQFFWNVLECFSQEELCRFVKFACNQERIPQTCPCTSQGLDSAHVPPYPMKIVPPDNAGANPDSRYIRTETCMFMVKLPTYSTQNLMRERLLYSINYRDDPLSG